MVCYPAIRLEPCESRDAENVASVKHQAHDIRAASRALRRHAAKPTVSISDVVQRVPKAGLRRRGGVCHSVGWLVNIDELDRATDVAVFQRDVHAGHGGVRHRRDTAHGLLGGVAVVFEGDDAGHGLAEETAGDCAVSRSARLSNPRHRNTVFPSDTIEGAATNEKGKEAKWPTHIWPLRSVVRTSLLCDNVPVFT